MKVFLKRNIVISAEKVGMANTIEDVPQDTAVSLIGSGKADKYNAKVHDSRVKKAAIVGKRVDKR